ncbi:hypothetical protein [Candidatus Albibeggiatoa sp. nov. NOAA]|uniref:hypothetical protein n=1 Tax=Candidatus Albibeggiatoa sp. nov. NOAA TaxID=3162724 RepID=UPI0033000779|nr:hypothetical protein [Thiotrichaceae bacterium]
MTKKDEWYQNRILWQAQKHKLFEQNRCYHFSDLSEEQISFINKTVSKNINPLVVFWDSQEKWTVLGTRAICSFHGGNLVFAKLDKIKELNIFHPPDATVREIKLESEFLSLDSHNKKLIWTPSGGACLFGLTGILRMFPLGVPACQGSMMNYIRCLIETLLTR